MYSILGLKNCGTFFIFQNTVEHQGTQAHWNSNLLEEMAGSLFSFSQSSKLGYKGYSRRDLSNKLGNRIFTKEKVFCKLTILELQNMILILFLFFYAIEYKVFRLKLQSLLDNVLKVYVAFNPLITNENMSNSIRKSIFKMLLF